VIPPAWTEVWICPYANGHLQCVGRDEAGRRQYLYHPVWREQQDAEKFERVQTMARQLPRVRRELRSTLDRTGPPDREVALGAAVRLVDLGCFRLGDDAYTDAYGSHGLTTLECRHLTTTSDGVAFAFVGKSGVDQLIEVTDPRVCRAVRSMSRSRRRDSRLLCFRDSRRWTPVAAEDINSTIRDLFDLDVTAKDFRTWHATVRVATALGSVERAGTVPGRNRQVRAAVVAASELLGNTPTVARGSYVDPRVIDLFEDDETIAASVARLDADPQVAEDQLDRAVVRLLS
jgi:DNA topoisomerase IB